MNFNIYCVDRKISMRIVTIFTPFKPKKRYRESAWEKVFQNSCRYWLDSPFFQRNFISSRKKRVLIKCWLLLSRHSNKKRKSVILNVKSDWHTHTKDQRLFQWEHSFPLHFLTGKYVKFSASVSPFNITCTHLTLLLLLWAQLSFTNTIQLKSQCTV